MKKWLLLALMALNFGYALAQGEIDDEKKILYRNEWSLAFDIKTNGVNFDYRSGKFVNAFKKNLWDAGFATIRHPQEIRQTNPYADGYGQFCYGKKNFCFETYYSRGRQRTLFQKQDKGSVEIRLVYFAGASLAFLKPIYYEVYYDIDDIRSEKCDVESQSQNAAIFIFGKSEFTKGFSEIKVVPGVYGKAALSFEFGKTDKKLVALEAGIKFSAYVKEVEIMDQKSNQQFITNLFIGVRLGKVKHGAQYERLNDLDL